MRNVIILMMVLAIAGTAIAQDGSQSQGELPIKNKPNMTYVPPGEVKVGGDTIFDATEIPGIPYTDTGNTTLFNHDYDELCPSSSGSPDVVYSFTPSSDMSITVDLCGSGYDTKAFIYDSDLAFVACDDDYYGDGHPCGSWTSKIEGVPLTGGITYFIIIDGWGGEFGPYNLSITDFSECEMTCYPDAVAEGEPPIENGYVDNYNTGCNTDPPIVQTIDWANTEDGEAWLCGNAGWFITPDGAYVRDTDWFSVIALGYEMTFTLQSEYTGAVWKFVSTGCPATTDLYAISICGEPATLTFPTTPGEEIWLAVAAAYFQGVITEFTYNVTLTGHDWLPPVATEETSWGGVKALYR